MRRGPLSSTNPLSDDPVIQLVPLIDILAMTLLFFVTISALNQYESEINISVPKSTESKDSVRSPGEIIINITKEGRYIVNQQPLDQGGLENMLQRVSTLFPDQPVIIRADEKTYHQYVVAALDACAKANIWDISFSTDKVTDKPKEK